MLKQLSLAALLAAAISASADEVPGSGDLRLNQIQVIASHNSYHLLAEEPLFSQVKAVYPKAAEWEYEHKPLNEQLDHGVRSFEIDLYHHPEGTRVFHVPQFDMRSSCETFMDCATLVRDWSRAHPRHVPILILLELKEEPVPQANVPVLPFDDAALAQLESEVNAVFEKVQLLRPDDVRGDAATLRDAIRTRGWPKLDDVRGRVFFVLHTGNKRYAEDHPTLEGRAMFLQAYGDEDYAAVYVLNDPADPEIPKRVKEGFIIRTRADAGMEEAVANDHTRFTQALTSGAQIITTDYPPGEPHAKTGYTVAFEHGSVARLNPVATAE